MRVLNSLIGLLLLVSPAYAESLSESLFGPPKTPTETVAPRITIVPTRVITAQPQPAQPAPVAQYRSDIPGLPRYPMVRLVTESYLALRSYYNCYSAGVIGPADYTAAMVHVADVEDAARAVHSDLSIPELQRWVAKYVTVWNVSKEICADLSTVLADFDEIATVLSWDCALEKPEAINCRNEQQATLDGWVKTIQTRYRR